jgi:hypothetical protein
MTASPKSTLNGNLIVSSGSVCIPVGQTFEIIPVPVGLVPLRVRFRFDAVEGAPTSIGVDVSEPLVAQVKLVNFNSSIGHATIEPMVLGNINGRVLRVLLIGYRIGEPPGALNLLTYTLTLTGSADV